MDPYIKDFLGDDSDVQTRHVLYEKYKPFPGVIITGTQIAINPRNRGMSIHNTHKVFNAFGFCNGIEPIFQSTYQRRIKINN
jgi:hypothetical protein